MKNALYLPHSSPKGDSTSPLEECTPTLGVVVGRFQTPELHAGHCAVIEHALAHHTSVLVVVGVRPANATERHPLDYKTREVMLRGRYGDAITIAPLQDCADDRVWSTRLDELVDIYSKFCEAVCLYGSRDSFIKVYSGKWPVQYLDAVQAVHPATHLRRQAADTVLDSPDFRAGMMYAQARRFAAVYPTVDIAVFHRHSLLTVQKPGEPWWRLPGGFVDPGDVSFEKAALRELREECGDIVVGKMRYCGTVRMNDWRYADSSDALVTALFCTRYRSGEPVAADDVAALRWIPVEKLFSAKDLYKPHKKLMLRALAREFKPRFG